MKAKVCIVGAGVIGLSTAVCVTQALRGEEVEVTIIAEHLTPSTTGDGAAGFWQPFMVGEEDPHNVAKLRKWGGLTFQHLAQLARSSEARASGTFFVSGYDLHHNEATKPFYWDQVLTFRAMSAAELGLFPSYRFGFSFTTMMAEGKRYLPWLMHRFISQGGHLVQKKLLDFKELAGQYDVVVNCTGLAARELAADDQVYPIKGQTIRVSAPWLKHFVLGEDAEVLVGADNVLLGGTHEKGVGNTNISTHDRQAIWEKCCDLVPSLKAAEPVCDWAGLRPGRPCVRLEAEEYKTGPTTMKIVHNYGHGGAGITLHWGCALEASQLVISALQRTASAKL